MSKSVSGIASLGTRRESTRSVTLLSIAGIEVPQSALLKLLKLLPMVSPHAAKTQPTHLFGYASLSLPSDQSVPICIPFRPLYFILYKGPICIPFRPQC